MKTAGTPRTSGRPGAPRTSRVPSAVVAPLAAGALLAGCAEVREDPAREAAASPTSDPGTTTEEPAFDGDSGPTVTAELRGPGGEDRGTVTISEAQEGTEVVLDFRADELDPGFYAFHIHAVGECEPDSQDPDDPDEVGDFLSAGGHLGGDEDDHGHHAGDLPPVYLTAGGHGRLVALTDRFTVADLQDDDGAAAMIHENPDNFANIPERYAPEGPDQDSLDTGDAGDRIACTVIE